ncbi:MAG TPA: hypothetical protein VFK04_09785 [Gemmatimonadaceae bacterium]|nr:hypothetical protein [Gemmatimonadaceae bacterium]
MTLIADPPRKGNGGRALSSPSLTTLGSAPIIAVFVAALALLPIGNWIPGGNEVESYRAVMNEWLNGTAIVLGVAVVLTILSRKLAVLWRDDPFGRVFVFTTRQPRATAVTIAVLAGVLYSYVALVILGGRPLNIDEIVQVLQAQIFTQGRLSLSLSPHPAFFSSMNVVETHGRYFAQFPAGGPAMLAIGVLLGVTWIVGPICGAVTVLAYWFFLRHAEPRRGVALGALLLFAFAPFVFFVSGSHMNDVTSLMWTAVAIAAMATVVNADQPRPALAFLSGFAFGCAATIRPVDAVAFALPAGLWYLTRALRARQRWLDAVPAAAGVAIPMAALLWVNSRTTGAPLLFGYEALWGKAHNLGFHTAPWGTVHTPAHGLELINIYFLKLQTYAYESPLPSLIPFIGALLFTRKLSALDRYLLTASALLVALYFCYWFGGFYHGPRFVYFLMLPIALWTARFLPLVADRFGTGSAVHRASVYGMACAGLISLCVSVPFRARLYAASYPTARFNADSAAAAAGVENAIVFVRESWGAQMVARMWALGISPSDAEHLYWQSDACELEEGIRRAENTGLHDQGALAALEPLIRPIGTTQPTPFSPDSSERYVPGTTYTPHCMERIAEDRAGFTPFVPFLLAHGGGNIYARDLSEQNALLKAQYPSRQTYLLKPVSSEVGAPFRFYPLGTDPQGSSPHTASQTQ